MKPFVVEEHSCNSGFSCARAHQAELRHFIGSYSDDETCDWMRDIGICGVAENEYCCCAYEVAQVGP